VSAARIHDSDRASDARARFVVGVTGGIGSGKSTVAELFHTLGAALVDTDAIAHELTLPGQPAVMQIAEHFGEAFVTADGSLDRAALRAKVFSDVAARRELEDLLHPMIRREVDTRVSEARGPYVLLLIPLLVETGGYAKAVDRVLVVDCDEDLQVQRTMRRSGLTEDEVRAIIRSQASRAERLALADDVIHNNGGLAELAPQVQALHARYRRMAT
jgi:dephospho-CoA kinase